MFLSNDNIEHDSDKISSATNEPSPFPTQNFCPTLFNKTYSKKSRQRIAAIISQVEGVET